MSIDEAEKIKTVVENKDYIVQLVNTVAKTLIEAFENLTIEDAYMFQLGYNKAIDDFANGISEYLGVENATKYGNKNAEQQGISYDTLMKYEIADAIEDVAEQLKAGGMNETN